MNMKTILRPSSWTIAVKLAVAMLIFSILPMIAIAQYGLNRAFENITNSELENLQRFANGMAIRMELVIANTGYVASYLSWDRDAAELLMKHSEHNRNLLLDKMLRLQAANSSIDLVMVLDTDGRVVVSTIPIPAKMDFRSRNYFKGAIKGSEFISGIEVGYLTKNAGIFFSSPIFDSNGSVIGVAALKLKASAITSLLDEITGTKTKKAFIVDTDGIIIYHPDSVLMYKSLAPLDAETKIRINAEKKFATEQFESLGMDTLWQAFKNSREPSCINYYSPYTKQNELLGFATLHRMGWVIAVSEKEMVLTVPLDREYRNFMAGVAVFALFLTLVSALFAGTFVKPLRVLMAAARAVERGDYKNSRVTESGSDEIGEMSKIFNTMAEGVQARERERDILGRVVSPEVRDKLLASDINLVGENRRVTILFSDIRGFTTLSEQMHPHDVVAMLNEYLGEMSEAVRHYGGYINNFIGDAIVVIFGAPLGWEDNEERALMAAVEMRARLKILNTRRTTLGEQTIESGIGISTGKVVAGQVGSAERFLYTVIGDAVNIASRLETLTRKYPDNPILINAATYEKVMAVADFTFRPLGAVTLKGKAEAIEVYAVYPVTVA